MIAPNTVLKAVRMAMRKSQEELARAVREAGQQLGEPNDCSKRQVARWESGAVSVPRPVYVRPLEIVTGREITELGFAGAERYGAASPREAVAVTTPELPAHILDSVPQSFDAHALSGHWVTCYEFHAGVHHADIAHITAESSSVIRAVNYPPEPRTEGRSYTFRNQIEAQLYNRHLIGHWKNVSDTRYFGSLHLAVLPGEIVMEGYYTGFANDIGVSMEPWKWVRLADVEIAPDMTLREPTIIYDLVMKRSQFDAPLLLTDVTEENPHDAD